MRAYINGDVEADGGGGGQYVQKCEISQVASWLPVEQRP